MKILGLQKLTLLDYPSNVACTVFTGGCNFRCPFCHNASLVFMAESNEISDDDLFAFLRKRSGILDGVCITGGEPLINDDIFDFAARIKDMGYKVKLDTNGSFPEKLKDLITSKLVDFIAMDIKNSPAKYSMTAGIEQNTDKIVQSIHTVMTSGTDYEFRTTVVKNFHEAEDFHEIGKLIQGAENYYLQAFVDSGNLISSNLSGCSLNEMEKFKQIASLYVKNAEIRGK